MNKLELPDYFDDHAALVALSQNGRVSSNPALLPYVDAIRAGYDHYLAENGNPAVITAVALPNEIKNYLLSHYAKPPNDLSYIKKLRAAGGIKTCPMCGSLYGGTLDHVLPKAAFQCYAIFGLNLVPACKCNVVRNNQLFGANPEARILHPYFDAILGERILSARFTDLGLIPHVTIRVIIDENDPFFPAAQFHLENVVAKTQVADWVAGEWTKLMLRPGNVIRDLRDTPATRNELIAILRNERAIVDDSLGSKNNWQSIFLGGLLDDEVVDWLFASLNQVGRGSNEPLMEV